MARETADEGCGHIRGAIAAIVVILIVALASAFTVEQTEGTRPAFRRAGRRARGAAYVFKESFGVVKCAENAFLKK